jgi:hypothetical protein
MQQYMAVQPMRYLIESEINYLIQMEIKAVPEKVGPPARILTIDSTGPRWMQHSEGCNIGVPGEEPENSQPPKKHR